MDPKTQALLSGMGNWAGIGAGAGALGMGAASLMQPNDPNDPENHHHKSLLKSMLLGGALGGVVGGGGRAMVDAFSPAMAANSGSGLELLGQKAAPSVTESKADAFTQAAGGHPKLTGLGVGTGIAVGSSIGQRSLNNTLKKSLTAEELKGFTERGGPKLSRANAFIRNPLLHGLATGLGTYGWGKVTEKPLAHELLNNQYVTEHPEYFTPNK